MEKKQSILKPMTNVCLHGNSNVIHLTEGNLLSRLLYPNPVCLLTTRDPSGRDNVMTITWLTPINNQGNFICSLNPARFSVEMLKTCPYFTLSVPTQGMESLVLDIGGCSGRETDKTENILLKLVTPGESMRRNDSVNNMENTSFTERSCIKGGGEAVNSCQQGIMKGEERREEAGIRCTWTMEGEGLNQTCTTKVVFNEKIPKAKQLNVSLKQIRKEEAKWAVGLCTRAIPSCVAHLVCKWLERRDVCGHVVFTCVVMCAYVCSEYWDGRNFIPQTNDIPPYLTFLGTKKFGYVRKE